MAYKENTVLDYLSGSGFQLGTVVKDNDERITVQGRNQEKINRRQVLTEYPSGIHLEACQREVDAQLKDMDVPLVWEILSENPGECSMESVSVAYFGDSIPLHLSVIARALYGDTDHFQRSSSVQSIKVRSRQEVEEILALKAQRCRRAEEKERAVSWLAATVGYKGEGPCPVPEEYQPLLNNIVDYLMCGTNSDTVNLLSRISAGMCIRENAIRILKATQQMPVDADEFLLSNGIHAGFPKQVLQYTEELPEEFSREGRRLIEDELIFSIDDAETVEIDDALSCRRAGENYVVGIYIADPACYVQKGDPLDMTAEERPLSLYLPTTTVKMFPERVSSELASLRQGEERPVLAFQLTLNKDGEILDWSLAPSVIKVNRRLTYVEADEIMDHWPQDACYQPLKDLLELSDTLRYYREEDGGISLNRPELHVRVHDNDISIEYIDQNTPSRRMVSEYMVQANSLAARYALHHEIPVIYRVQEAPSGQVYSVKEYDAYIFDQNVRRMKRTRLSTYPQPHFGLGLDLYIQISSPLRRYADLVMHRQLAAHCMKQSIPYTQEELFSVLDNVETTSHQNRSLQREADEYWLLEYLRRNCIGKDSRATVVRVEGRVIIAELEFYCVRGVLLCREHPNPGEHCTVEIKEVYPENHRLILQKK